jgi:hypothetical protein
MKKKLLLGAAGLLLVGIGAAIAQLPTPSSVLSVGATDLFLDVVGGAPSPTASYATAGLIGNTASVAYSVPLTAFTITQGVGTTWTIINPAGTLATGTFTLSPSPTNGSRACFVSTQVQSAVTFTANTGQSIVNGPGSTSMATAGTPICFTYVSSISSWIKA